MSYFDFYTREFRSSVPQNGVIVAPLKAYILNTSTNTVSVIDTSLDTVIKTITLIGSAIAIEITPDGKKAYLVLGNQGKIVVIDTVTDTISKTITSTGIAPSQLTITADGARVYVTNLFSDDIDVIETTNDTILTTIATGSFPERIKAMSDDSKVYFIANAKIGVIDNSVNPPVLITGAGFPITVGTSPKRLEITPDAARVYVSNGGSSNVSVISTATDTVIATLAGAANPQDLAILPDDSKVYVGNINGASNTIEVIDNTQTPPVVDPTITSFSTPGDLQATANGARVYLTDSPDKIKIVDTATDTQLGTIITLAGAAETLKITPDSNKVYVTVPGSNNVTVIDNTVTPSIKTTITVGGTPRALAIQP